MSDVLTGGILGITFGGQAHSLTRPTRFQRRAGEEENFPLSLGDARRFVSDMPRPREPKARASQLQRGPRRPAEQFFAATARPHDGRSMPSCRRELPTVSQACARAGGLEKTIQRDIDFMRYAALTACRLSATNSISDFYYTEPVASFPTIQVSEGRSCALSRKALQQYHGTPFEAPLRAAFKKIGDGLNDKVSFTWSDLDSAISFRNVGQSEGDLEVLKS